VGGRAGRQRHRHPALLVIFFLGQRYFVEGIATTGHKG
jgi:ABC-type maltose transport system permease subunit